MVSEANAVHDWLKTTWKVTAPDDWLQACVDWIHAENDGGHAALSELCNLVFEQWLVCDLREIGASCLPPGLSQQAKHVLNGTYGLQINSMADVGTPFYGQLQKVKGTENSNASVSATQATQPSWEPKPSRMLMMKLTDGTQDIQAMEYQPISELNASLAAGTKIVVLGGVLCRSGVLMLKAENIRVLGGEVDSLVEENTVERVLSRALQHNIDLNVGPTGLPRKAFEVERHKANVSKPSSSGRQPKPDVASVAERRWQTTVAVEQNNNNSRSRFMDMEEIPDDDLVTIATSVDEMNSEQVQWGEEDFDYEGAAEMMDCEDYDARAPLSRPSCVMKSGSNAETANKRLICTDNENTAKANLVKKSRTAGDKLVKNNVMDLVDDVDFDDDDFDWQTSLGSVCKTKRTEITPVKKEGDLPKETKTLSSKLCKRAALTNQQRKIETATTHETSSSGSRAFADRVGLRSVISVTDDEATYLESSSRSQKETSSLLTPAVVAGRQPIGPLVTAKVTSIEQSRKASSNDLRVAHSSDAVPFTYLSQAMTKHCYQLFNVKAYISTLVGRLEHNEGSHWSLVVKINDGSAAVNVNLTNELLTELIGFSAVECMKMRQQARVDKSIRQKLVEGIQRCQENLIQLSSIMEVEVSPGVGMPSVRSFRSVTESDIEALRQRIEFRKSCND